MRLIATIGLPGCGKTTWANDYCLAHPEFIRVSKDDIRAELTANGWVWSHAAEKRDVLPARDQMIRCAFASGQSVISDDTNLTSKHMNALAMLASSAGAKFEIQDFRNVEIGVCIARDAERPVPVGATRIREMARSLGNVQ